MKKPHFPLAGMAFGVLALSLSLSLSAPTFGGSVASIPVVGNDEQGRPIEEQIPGTEYSGQLQTMVSAVNDSMIEALGTQSASATWKLTSIVVGVGFGAEAGVGPLIKVKAAPRFRVAFSKTDEPVLP